ncbi:MAG: ABC transporter permease [Candidatus Micrarchaeota archaeon]|nr:ABC transporter permease [Candidatus Micrarchaeota archaeon]
MVVVGNGGKEKALDWRKIRAIVWKNWLVMKGDRMRLIPLMIFPIIMICVFGFATSGTVYGLPAALVDNDHSPESIALCQALRSVGAISISREVGTESEAKRLMDEGRIKALIIIPAGFGKALETGSEQARLVVEVDESDSTVAQIIKAVLQQTAGAYSRQQAMAKLAMLKAKQDAASEALGQGAGSLDSLSKSLSDGSQLKADEKSLRYVAAIMQNDLRQTGAQETGLKNALMAVAEGTDAYKVGGVPLSSDVQTIAQIQALEARKAVDEQALAAVNQLLASNAKSAAAASASASAASGAGDAMEGAAASLGNGPIKVEVFSAPVAYVNKPAYGEGRKNIDFTLPSIIAMVIFQGATMGMGRALAGEKKDGSLTRVFLTPTSNVTILTGTALFYTILESFRSSLLVFAAMLLFGVTLKGSLLSTLFLIVIFAAGCTGIGLLLSAISNSQEQYMAVSMLVSMPIMFLSGVFFPVQTMPQVLQGVANILPVAYAATALRGVMIKGFDLATVMPEVVILVGFAVAFIALALLVFKREIV